jgi:hypothetical protein
MTRREKFQVASLHTFDQLSSTEVVDAADRLLHAWTKRPQGQLHRYGTMTFHGGSWGSRREDSFAILDRYLGLGGTFVNAADIYGGGRSEETLGTCFTANPGKRERVVSSTKFGATLIPDDPNAGGAGRKAIITELDRSLSRLKTDYVDLYWHTRGTSMRRLTRRVPHSTTGRSQVDGARSYQIVGPLPAKSVREHYRLPGKGRSDAVKQGINSRDVQAPSESNVNLAKSPTSRTATRRLRRPVVPQRQRPRAWIFATAVAGALADHARMGADAKDMVVAFEPGHFG